jgi:hypothetical protein
MKFAYADPPYLGCGKSHYGHQHDEAHVYDAIDGHQRLADRLSEEFPDGWAMSSWTCSPAAAPWGGRTRSGSDSITDYLPVPNQGS